jgi:hypothetical protein
MLTEAVRPRVHPITNGSKPRATPVWFASRDVAQARRAFVTRKAGSDVNLCCRKGTLSRAIGAVALAMTVGALELTSEGVFQGARDFLLEPRPGRRDHQHPQLCPGRAQRAAGSRRAEGRPVHRAADPGVPRAAAGRGPGRAGRGRAGERLVRGDAGDGGMSEPEEGGGVWTVFARGETTLLQPPAAEQAPRGKRRGSVRPSGEGRRCLKGVPKASEKYVSGNLG